MGKFFIPYAGDFPLAIEVKGHRLILLSSESDEILDELHLIGGEEIRELEIIDEHPEESDEVALLAANAQGGVVVLPAGVSPQMMIESLETELPWVH